MCRLYGEHPTSHHELPEALRDPSMAFDCPRWPSIPFDGLRYPSIPFEAPRDTFEALRTLVKPFGPLPLLHHIVSLDPSGPPPSTDDFELLKRQFEPSRISRLISQAPLAGPSLPALASAY